MRRLVFAATVASVGLLWAADQDATLREAQKQEKAGNAVEAVKVFKTVYGDKSAPGHQRLAALCGLLRTDAAHLAD